MSRSHFERFVGLDTKQVRQGRHAVDLARLAGIDPIALGIATPSRGVHSRAVRVGNTWTDFADLTGRSFRVCPACIAVDRSEALRESRSVEVAAWIRPEWSIRSIFTCVLHNCLLLTNCQSCGAKLSADNPAVDVCRCGSPIDTQKTPPLRSGVDALLGDMIAGRIVPPLFIGVGLHQVSSHLVRLGCLTLGQQEKRPLPGKKVDLNIREVGLELSLGSDKQLFAHLDMIVSKPAASRSGRPGLISSYGWVLGSWLREGTPNSLDRALLEKVLIHAERAGIYSPYSADGATLKEVRTILRSGHRRARQVAAAAGLLGGADLPGVPMCINRRNVEEIAASGNGLIDATTAAKLLGIGRSQFRSLVTAGLIRADKRAVALQSVARFKPEALSWLVEKTSADAPQLVAPPSDCVSLPMACRNASIPLSKALKAIFEGLVRPIAWSGSQTLDGIWVKVGELRALVPRARTTARFAARQLGLHYDAALWLSGRGLLGHTPGDVDPTSVENFAAEYCTSAQVAASLGVPTKSAVARLRHAGLRPTFGPPACRQAIWSRDAVRRSPVLLDLQ